MIAFSEQTIQLPAEQALFRSGDLCTGYINLLSGSYRVVNDVNTPAGQALYTVHPGQVCVQTFSSLINRQSYSAMAISDTPVEFSILPEAQFIPRFINDKDFQQRLLKGIAERFNELSASPIKKG